MNADIQDTPVHFVAVWLKDQPLASKPPAWKGGWERWAQGQVALYMDDRDGYKVWPEEHIYANAADNDKACDLDFAKNGVHTYCELKCLSEVNDDTANKFLKAVKKDYEKVQTKLVPAAKGSTMWVVALSQQQFRDSIVQEAQDPQFAFWQRFKYVTVQAPGNWPGKCTFDIWYWKFVNNV
ncbi:hypothetical protein F4808DRAFT_472943 [Astrocystis sublimbata]|nr:hypothetical protein F4808DRAFT_472943 [Astrocystis sublimbata]